MSTPPLSAAAAAAVATWGSLLRVFARAGDRLWLPAPLSADRLTDALPRVVLEHGPPERLEPASATLSWASSSPPDSARPLMLPTNLATEPVARSASADALPALEPRPLGRVALRERLWSTPAHPVAAKVADRRLCRQIAERAGLAAPGCEIVSTPGELDALLDRRQTAGHAGPWVLKSTLSAAGRHRVFGGFAAPAESEAPLEPSERSKRRRRRALETLLLRGPAVFEPWETRVADFGLRLWIDSEGARFLGAHRLLVDARGGFRGIEVEEPTAEGVTRCLGPGGDGADDRSTVARAIAQVGADLSALGYRGPVGLDGRRVVAAERGLSGGGGPTTVLRPLGEINPRLTFGFVAAAIAEHLAATGRIERPRGRLAAEPESREPDARSSIRLLEGAPTSRSRRPSPPLTFRPAID